MKLFSLGRTDLAVSSKLPAAVSSIKLQNDNENAAHVRNGKVLWRSPETVVSRTASSVEVVSLLDTGTYSCSQRSIVVQ